MKRIRNPEPIAKILRDRRLAENLTISYLSWSTGIGQQNFSQFERGENNSLFIFMAYEPFLTSSDWEKIRAEVRRQNDDAKRNFANGRKSV